MQKEFLKKALLLLAFWLYSVSVVSQDENSQELLYRANMMAQSGQVENAKALFQQLMENLEAQEFLDTPTYSYAAQQIATIEFQRRNYPEVLSVIVKAKSFIEEHNLLDPYATRNLEVQYGSVLFAVGSFNEAFKHIIHAKWMYEQAGDYGQGYLSCLLNLIDVCVGLGDFAYTKLYIDEINHIIEKLSKNVYFENSSEKHAILTSLSSLYALLGYESKAMEQLNNLLEQHKGDTNSMWNAPRILFSMLLMKNNEWTQAESILNDIVEASDLNTNQKKLMGLIMCQASQGKKETGNILRRYREMVHNNISTVMSTFSHLERQQFWNSQTNNLAEGCNTVMRMMPDSKEIMRQCYDNALYIRSMQDKELHECHHWEDISRSLSDNEVAIEFIAMPNSFMNNNQFRFGALVLRNDGKGPQFVDLCDSAPFMKYFQDVIHTDTTLINSLYSSTNQELYQLLWKPLENLLHSNEHIYYNPTGFLCQVAFEAICDGKGIRLGERYCLHQVTTTADIISCKSHKWKKPRNAVLYGGISYEESTEEMTAAAKPYGHDKQEETLLAVRSLSSTRGALVDELEGTREEVMYINNLLKSEGCQPILLMDDKANEESVKDLSGKAPAILHLSTHGFMLSTNQDQQQHRSFFEQALVQGNNEQAMMLHSGLLMAGANRAWRGEPNIENVEDGILTAYEVSQLDLSKCQLVVLSACETGLGFINNTTGDIGLKRAFKLAGAKSVIVSLWEVPDVATAMLMSSFYENILRGDNPNEALKQARNTVKAKHPQPYYWAGFLIVD